MGHVHRSRREVLESIPVLLSGTALLSCGASTGQTVQPGRSGIIKGTIRDAATGKPTSAKMRVSEVPSGQAYMPAECVKTMPAKNKSGARYFYVRGDYEVAVPAGRYRVEVVRGICHEPEAATIEVDGTVHRHDVSLKYVADLHRTGWYSGNTHTHYNVEIEESVDERMRIVPPAEAVDVSVISYLIRNKLPYSSNRIPVGRLPGFSRDGVIMDMGEECRNNFVSKERPHNLGYGHCLFLNIPRLVEPVSTGQLSPDGKAPDFPTLSMLCAEARRLGGTTVWCHNGHGMEAPVAIALGHVDALNIADGFPVEYDWYYRFLNCGFRLPISTGTDWWEYDHNRVFVRVEGGFRYESWLDGLRAGRTFISNGPLLDLTVNGHGPGGVVKGARRAKVIARAISRVPFERLELVVDGSVVAQKNAVNQREAVIEQDLPADRTSWIAARVAGTTETLTGFRVFAHTNPVYIEAAGPLGRRGESARAVAAEIEDSMRFMRKNYQFASAADQALALGRFEEGRRYYARLAGS
jgi:hypothetical protein